MSKEIAAGLSAGELADTYDVYNISDTTALYVPKGGKLGSFVPRHWLFEGPEDEVAEDAVDVSSSDS